MDYSKYFSADVPSFLRSPVREIFQKVDLSAICSFAGGYPAAVTFPMADIPGLTARVLEKYGTKALQYGAFRSVLLTNRQCIFERCCEQERVLVAVNADENEFMAHFDAGCGKATDLITGEEHDFGGGSLLPGYSVRFWKMER